MFCSRRTIQSFCMTLVLRNFFSALRSGRNVQEAFEQPVCFSALSSLLAFNEYQLSTSRCCTSKWLEHAITQFCSSFDFMSYAQNCCPALHFRSPVVVWPLCSILLVQHNRVMLVPSCCFLKVGVTDGQCV